MKLLLSSIALGVMVTHHHETKAEPLVYSSFEQAQKAFLTAQKEQEREQWLWKRFHIRKMKVNIQL